MKIRRMARAVGIVLPLLAASVHAELCQDADGVWRTCSGTNAEEAPVSDAWKDQSADDALQSYLKARTPEEKKAAELRYQSLRNQEWQDHQDTIEEHYEQRRQEIQDDSDQRRRALEERWEQRDIHNELKWNNELSRKSPVEQRYYLEQHGYGHDAVNKAYGR